MAYSEEELAALKAKAAKRNAGLANSANNAAQSAGTQLENNIGSYENLVANGDYNSVYQNATDSNVGWNDYLSSLDDISKNQLKSKMASAATSGQIEGYAGKTDDGQYANTAYQAAWEKAMNGDVTVPSNSSDFDLLDNGPSSQTILLTNLTNSIKNNDYDGVANTLATMKSLGIDISGMDAQNLPNYLKTADENAKSRAQYGVYGDWDSAIKSTNDVGNLAGSNEVNLLKEKYGDNWRALATGQYSTNVPSYTTTGTKGQTQMTNTAVSGEENLNNAIKQCMASGDYDTAAALVKVYAANSDDPQAVLEKYSMNNIANTVGYSGTKDSEKSFLSGEWMDNLSDGLRGLFYDETTNTYSANPTYATSDATNALFTNADALQNGGDTVNPSNTTTTNGANGSTKYTTTKKSTVNGGGTTSDDPNYSDGSNSESEWLSNFGKVNEIVQNGSKSALDQYKSNYDSALSDIEKAKGEYNYTGQLKKYNKAADTYSSNMNEYNNELDQQKNAAENWQTYMNPLTEYLNQQLAENAKGSAGSMLNSSATQNSINKAITDNTAAQYQNAVNTAMNQATQNTNIINQKANNAGNVMNNEQQRLENNITPTTDWAAYKTDQADTQYNNQMNVVNTQAGLAAQQPTQLEGWTDLLKSAIEVGGMIMDR